MKRRRALHLEARHLQHDNVPWLVHVRRERLAEVPPDEGAPAVTLQDRADDRCRGALAVGAADRHDRRRVPEGPDGELHLADDRHTAPRRLLQLRERRDTGGHDHEIGALDARPLVPTEHELGADGRERRPLRLHAGR